MKGILRAFKEHLVNLTLHKGLTVHKYLSPFTKIDSGWGERLPHQMTYTPQQISNYFLDRANQEGIYRH